MFSLHILLNHIYFKFQSKLIDKSIFKSSLIWKRNKLYDPGTRKITAIEILLLRAAKGESCKNQPKYPTITIIDPQWNRKNNDGSPSIIAVDSNENFVPEHPYLSAPRDHLRNGRTSWGDYDHVQPVSLSKTDTPYHAPSKM